MYNTPFDLLCQLEHYSTEATIFCQMHLFWNFKKSFPIFWRDLFWWLKGIHDACRFCINDPLVVTHHQYKYPTIICTHKQKCPSMQSEKHLRQSPSQSKSEKQFCWSTSLCVIIWATSWQNHQTYMCAQRRLRSAWASAQSDRSSLCALGVAKDPSFLHADSEDSDQSGRIPRLIWVFDGRTCHFVGFVTSWLNYFRISATMKCNFDLRKFPMDGQHCSVQMESCKYLRVLPSPISSMFLMNPKLWSRISLCPKHAIALTLMW